MVKIPPASIGETHRFDPWSGRSHIGWGSDACATAAEAHTPGPCAGEAAAVRLLCPATRGQPRALQREKARPQQ